MTKLQAEILQAFHVRGDMTDEQLVNLLQFNHLSHQTVRTRRNELVSLGYLTLKGQQKDLQGKRFVRVWGLPPKELQHGR